MIEMIKKILIAALSINSLIGLVVFLWGMIESVKDSSEKLSIGWIVGCFFIFITVLPICGVFTFLRYYFKDLVYSIKNKIEFV